MMNINEAIKGAIKGNTKCQEHIYQRYARMLMTVCRRYKMADVQPIDILQDSFIEIFRNLEKYDPAKGKFENWITTICIRTAIKIAKKYNKFTTVQMDTVFDLPLTDESAIDKMSANEIMDIIDKIPAGYRDIFNLYVVDGYSHKEISTLFGIKESTSRSKLMRAREMIGKKILENNKKLKAI